MPQHHAPTQVAALDLHALTGFFHSVALAVELQSNSTMEWKTYSDSTVLNIAYALMPWKGRPGYVEVSSDWMKIKAAADARTSHFLHSFLAILSRSGPAMADHYAAGMDRVRQSALQSVHEMFADAASINQQVINETGEGLRRLAVIKCSSAVIISSVGCYIALGGAVPLVMLGGLTTGQAGLAVGGIGVGSDLVGAMIKNQHSWKDAGAVAISVGKFGIGAASDHFAVSAERRATESMARDGPALARAEATIRQLSADVARKVSSAKKAKLGRQMDRQIETATNLEQGMASGRRMATGAKVLGRGLAVVFFADDVYRAIGEMNETFEQSR